MAEPTGWKTPASIIGIVGVLVAIGAAVYAGRNDGGGGASGGTIATAASTSDMASLSCEQVDDLPMVRAKGSSWYGDRTVIVRGEGGGYVLETEQTERDTAGSLNGTINVQMGLTTVWQGDRVEMTLTATGQQSGKETQCIVILPADLSRL